MANHHQRTTSVPHVRLTQPLPPLPLNDIHIPPPPRLSIATQIPYRDDPEEEEEELLSARSPSQPPRYEPMYDYLRSRAASQSQSQSINLHLPPNVSVNLNLPNPTEEPYRDEPFVITIVDEVAEGELPPPSYNELYRQNDIEMETLMREFEIDGTPAEQTEEICKWVVAMLLVALTVACVGTVSWRHGLSG